MLQTRVNAIFHFRRVAVLVPWRLSLFGREQAILLSATIKAQTHSTRKVNFRHLRWFVLVWKRLVGLTERVGVTWPK